MNRSAAGQQPLLVATCLATCLAAIPGLGGEMSRLPVGFVHLREIDQTIVQDIRYAGAENFTGAPVRGYQASSASCFARLRRP